MEERLEALQEAWTSFIIEFPTYPKISAYGREESQRILFVCSAREENPTELCSALFNTQILMQKVQLGEVPESASRARFVLVYATEAPSGLRDVMTLHQNQVNAPILVANRVNVNKTAQYITEFLRRPMPSPNDSVSWAESANAARVSKADVEGALAPLPDGETLWQGVLPEITLTDSEGSVVKAAADIQDYRAEYACRYVLTHFQENINRDKMAEMVNLSPGYFSNLFRSEVGMSFSDYLIQVRIENAKRLLRRFDLSVEAISKQCGFNSLAHFSRTFKDRCGLSPLKYRKSPNSQA